MQTLFCPAGPNSRNWCRKSDCAINGVGLLNIRKSNSQKTPYIMAASISLFYEKIPFDRHMVKMPYF